jgi:hypothetical protein
LPPIDSRHIVWAGVRPGEAEDRVMMHGDVRVSDPGRDAAAFRDPWAADGRRTGRPGGAYPIRPGLARLRHRVLLALAVVTGSVVAVVSLLIALVLFHAGWLGFALVALLGLGSLVAAAVAGLAWTAWRMWRRGAWLEALPLLAGQPWLSRVVWAARLIWTGRSLWRLRARLRPASRY